METKSPDKSRPHTDFREAVMRAYVWGWMAGREGTRDDDGKWAAANELEDKFPAEANGKELLEALRTILRSGGCQETCERSRDHCKNRCSYTLAERKANVVLAKLKPMPAKKGEPPCEPSSAS